MIAEAFGAPRGRITSATALKKANPVRSLAMDQDEDPLISFGTGSSLWHGFSPVQGGASDPGGCNSEWCDVAGGSKSGVPDPPWCKLFVGIIVEVVAAVSADAKRAVGNG
jgi:hypothetical protein